MFNYLLVKKKKKKDTGFTYLNQKRNTRHTNLSIMVVNTHVSGSFSQRKLFTWHICMNQKPSQQILWREFKYILSTIRFGQILDLSVSVYWL